MHDLHSFRTQPCLYPHQPPGDLILAPRSNPRIFPRQQQLDPHVEDAGGLQGRDGGVTLVDPQVVLLAGFVDRQALLGNGRQLRQGPVRRGQEFTEAWLAALWHRLPYGGAG